MKLNLYVADEFRTLEGGKTLAIGLFTDRVVVLNIPRDAPPPSQDMPYGLPLSLLACLVDLPAAEVKGSMKVLPPTGDAVMSVPSVAGKGSVGGSTNMIFRFDPFLMTGEGKYTAVLTFEGLAELSETFELRIRKTDEASASAIFIRQPGQTPDQSTN